MKHEKSLNKTTIKAIKDALLDISEITKNECSQ